MNQFQVNNDIKAKEVRVISETGEQLGIFPLESALQLAREKGLDLVQITEKVDPPVCKIVDYGKYLYQQKKRKGKKIVTGKLKEIRVSFNISERDLEIKTKQIKKFLEENNKVKISMLLKGREKGFSEIAKRKLEKFLEQINSLVPTKIEREMKQEARGFVLIIAKK